MPLIRLEEMRWSRAAYWNKGLLHVVCHCWRLRDMEAFFSFGRHNKSCPVGSDQLGQCLVAWAFADTNPFCQPSGRGLKMLGASAGTECIWENWGCTQRCVRTVKRRSARWLLYVLREFEPGRQSHGDAHSHHLWESAPWCWSSWEARNAARADAPKDGNAR